MEKKKLERLVEGVKRSLMVSALIGFSVLYIGTKNIEKKWNNESMEILREPWVELREDIEDICSAYQDSLNAINERYEKGRKERYDKEIKRIEEETIRFREKYGVK